MAETITSSNSGSKSRATHTSTSTFSPGLLGVSSLRRHENENSIAVCGARILFIVCLSCVAVALGYTAHHVTKQAETDLTETQFESIVHRALTEALVIAEQKRLSTITMASMVSEMYPDADKWPFVTVRGFERIANNLLKTVSSADMGFVPFVYPEKQSEWEDFIYNFYETERDPPMPNGTAVSSFGKGVWTRNRNLGTSDNKFHDMGNYTVYGSPNKLVTPVAHVKDGPHPILLFNLHSEPSRGRAIDDMIACSKERAARGKDISDNDCGV
jgi:hypothetical protein